MPRSRFRQIVVAVAVAVLLALLTDRIALYTWGLAVRDFHRSLHQSIEGLSSSASMSLTETSWHELVFVMSEDRPTDLIFLKSRVRPDAIRMDSHGIRLWYLPPALAWTTRVYPFYPGTGKRPRSYRPVDHYQYMLVFHGKGKWAKPVVELYRGPEQRPVAVTATRPELFP
jgi:hypothetical protein